MGLITRGGNYTNYLKIYDGSIIREWRKSKPSEDEIPSGKELEEREITKGKNSGNTIWFVRFDMLTGTLSDVSLEENKYGGESINVVIKDVDETYQLQIPSDSAYGASFLQKIHQVRVDEDLTIEPWRMDSNAWFEFTGKKINGNYKAGLNLLQEHAITDDNERGKLSNTFTKDNPQGMPGLIIKEDRKGNKTYDSTDMDNFLLNKLEDWIKSTFSGGTAVTSTKDPVAVGDDSEPTPKKGAKKKSGLPF